MRPCDLLLLLLPVASPAASTQCPCLTAYPSSITPGTITVAGAQYSVPNDFGIGSCKAHEENTEPFCNVPDYPSWCNTSWCYVDSDNCNNHLYTESTYWEPMGVMKYSYSTCGTSNTFTNWLIDETGSGGSGGGSYSLSTLASVMHSYLIGISNSLESNDWEVKSLISGSSTAGCSTASSCPCSGCTANSVYNGESISFHGATYTVTTSDTTSTQAKVDECLAGIIMENFMHVASREASTTRVGFAYAGFQDIGNFVQWPGIEWCPTDYDPRFRPWYAAAASGPKDVVIVVDVSGSMSISGRIDLAKSAVLAVIDTFTAADYATIVIFSDSASSFSASLGKMDKTRRLAMKAWAESNVYAGGGTNFVGAFDKADGEPSSWTDSEVASMTSSWTTAGEPMLFTYALGASAPTDKLKAIACDHKGVFQSVADGGSLANAMSSYYKPVPGSVD
eukprot:gene4697-8967_t